jgi:hypothetical protein
MPRAVLLNDNGDRRVFDIPFCPVHVEYGGRFWCLQPNLDQSPREWIYREMTGYRITDAQRA